MDIHFAVCEVEVVRLSVWNNLLRPTCFLHFESDDEGSSANESLRGDTLTMSCVFVCRLGRIQDLENHSQAISIDHHVRDSVWKVGKAEGSRAWYLDMLVTGEPAAVCCNGISCLALTYIRLHSFILTMMEHWGPPRYCV